MKRIIISQKSLDEFKKHVKEICPFPHEIEDEFESLYGFGNSPKEPTDDDWEKLREYYISEGLY
jgi:hypothetical protein